ncbi:unnamed protein product [Sphagnum balticum]
MSTSVVAVAFFACHLLYKGSAESVTERQGGREAGTQVGRHQRRSLLTTLVVGVKLLLQEEGRDRGDKQKRFSNWGISPGVDSTEEKLVVEVI